MRRDGSICAAWFRLRYLLCSLTGVCVAGWSYLCGMFEVFLCRG